MCLSILGVLEMYWGVVCYVYVGRCYVVRVLDVGLIYLIVGCVGGVIVSFDFGVFISKCIIFFVDISRLMLCL